MTPTGDNKYIKVPQVQQNISVLVVVVVMMIQIKWVFVPEKFYLIQQLIWYFGENSNVLSSVLAIFNVKLKKS